MCVCACLCDGCRRARIRVFASRSRHFSTPPQTCAGVYDPDFQFFAASKFFRENLSAGAGTSSRRAFSLGGLISPQFVFAITRPAATPVLLHESERYRAKRDVAINNAPPCEVANNKCECTKFCRMKV